jgi:hypothetical protein
MSYRSVLPQVFTRSVVVDEGQVAAMISKLLAPDSRFPNGSSFAITVDVEDGRRCVWLSESSAKRLGLAL